MVNVCLAEDPKMHGSLQSNLCFIDTQGTRFFISFPTARGKSASSSISESIKGARAFHKQSTDTAIATFGDCAVPIASHGKRRLPHHPHACDHSRRVT